MTGGIINTYIVERCNLCGQYTSTNGLALGAHLAMHVREGYLELTQWNPNDYERTAKPFNKEQYQKDHPNRAYTRDDYFPSDELRKIKASRKRHLRNLKQSIK